MAWEPQFQERTLIIQVSVVGGKKQYRINPFIRVKNTDTQTFLEPLPALTGSYKTRDDPFFDRIEFADAMGSDQQGLRGDLGMTHAGSRDKVLPKSFAS